MKCKKNSYLEKDDSSVILCILMTLYKTNQTKKTGHNSTKEKFGKYKERVIDQIDNIKALYLCKFAEIV